MKDIPNTQYEDKFWGKGQCVIGVDEVGRGCLAGDVYAGAVCFVPNNYSEEWIKKSGIRDSKQCTEIHRNKTYNYINNEIKNDFLAYSIGISSVEDINEKGIVWAVENAMLKAIKKIQEILKTEKALIVLADGLPIKQDLPRNILSQQAIVNGDALSLSIATASIIAKVERDKYMNCLDDVNPNYGFKKNKGYGTKEHREAIKKYGILDCHRKKFVHILDY